MRVVFLYVLGFTGIVFETLKPSTDFMGQIPYKIWPIYQFDSDFDYCFVIGTFDLDL